MKIILLSKESIHFSLKESEPMEDLKLSVEGNLTNETVKSIRNRCRTAAHDRSPITLDLSGVNEIDDDGIHLLMQIREYAKEKRVTCSLQGLSSDQMHLFTIIGLNDTIALRSA
jgi:anti-anti-sigma regulatory factor